MSSRVAAVAIRCEFAIAEKVIAPPGTDGKDEASTTWMRRVGFGRPRVSHCPEAGLEDMGIVAP